MRTGLTRHELFELWCNERGIAAESGIEFMGFPEFVRTMRAHEHDSQARDQAIEDAVAENEKLPPVRHEFSEEEAWRAAEAENPSDAYVRTTPVHPAPPRHPRALRVGPVRRVIARAARPRERRGTRRVATRAGPGSDDPPSDLPPLARLLRRLLARLGARR